MAKREYDRPHSEGALPRRRRRHYRHGRLRPSHPHTIIFIPLVVTVSLQPMERNGVPNEPVCCTF